MARCGGRADSVSAKRKTASGTCEPPKIARETVEGKGGQEWIREMYQSGGKNDVNPRAPPSSSQAQWESNKGSRPLFTVILAPDSDEWLKSSSRGRSRGRPMGSPRSGGAAAGDGNPFKGRENLEKLEVIENKRFRNFFDPESKDSKIRQALIDKQIMPRKEKMLEKLRGIGAEIDAEDSTALDTALIPVYKRKIDQQYPTVQETGDLEELYEIAVPIDTLFNTYINLMAADTKGDPKTGIPMKKEERLVEKKILRNEDDYKFARDIVRGSVVYDNKAGIAEAVKYILQNTKNVVRGVLGEAEFMVHIVDVKNFFKDKKGEYRALKLCLRFEYDGTPLICELQLQHRKMWDCREEDHEYYDLLRKSESQENIIDRKIAARRSSGKSDLGDVDQKEPEEKPAEEEIKDLLERSKLTKHLEAVLAEGYAYASELIDADEDELNGLFDTLELKKPQRRRLKKNLGI